MKQNQCPKFKGDSSLSLTPSLPVLKEIMPESKHQYNQKCLFCAKRSGMVTFDQRTTNDRTRPENWVVRGGVT